LLKSSVAIFFNVTIVGSNMFTNAKQILTVSFLVLGLSIQGHAYIMESDVEYDVVNNVSLKMDIFRPTKPNTELSPALIFTHGGCYSAGSKSEIHEDVKKMADAGFIVFSVEYRLSDIAKYPAGLTDVQQALRYIRKNAKAYQVDPQKIAALGESAGGYLAAVLGLRLSLDRVGHEDDFSARVQFVVDWYGRTDFTQTQSTGIDCAESWLGMPRTAENMPYFQEASLLPYVNSQSSPFLILHGTRDEQVLPLHSLLLSEQLKKSERPVEMVWVEGEGHDFDRTETWKLSRERLLKFFEIKSSD
jgi:acetyl esterase/lipase